MAASPEAPREDLPPSPSPSRDLSAFDDPAAAAVASELREALEPGIQVLRPLGAGAMGLVFLGRDPLLKRQVAIKILAPQAADTEAARARFIREAEASAAVSHPSIIGIHIVGELPRSKTPYFVMPFIEGRTLATEIEAGPLAEPRAKRIIGEIASALAAAHARGLVHRDIKPSNIILENESDRPIVLDFGISALLEKAPAADPKLTRTGTYLGTPIYMSPEQATGEQVSGKSDVYALGALAFEMLTGKPPFSGPAFVVMAAHVEKAPPDLNTLRSGIDPHLVTLVERCLKKKDSERPTAADVAQALLPDRRALVEWPPPGLENLHARGVRVTNWWIAFCATVLMTLTVMYLRPAGASPSWRGGEDIDGLWHLVASGSGNTDTAQAWLLLVAIPFLMMLAMLAGSLFETARFDKGGMDALRAGYPGRIVFDVAWDRHADTAALLNGAGGYALLTEDQRQLVVRARRSVALVGIAATLATAVAPLAWLLGWLGSIRGPDIMAWHELAGLLLPALVALVATAIINRRLRATVPLPQIGVKRRRKLRPELVESWLRTSARGVRAGRKDGGLWIVTSAAAGAILLVLGYVTLVVLYVAVSGALKVSFGRREMDRWMAEYAADSTRPLAFREYEALVRKSGVPQSRGAPDLAAGRLVIARGLASSGQRASNTHGVEADIEGARAIQALGGEPVAKVPDNFGQLFGPKARVNRETVAPMVEYAKSPWLETWRRVARSSDYPLTWAFNREIGDARDPWRIPVPSFVAARDLAYRNDVAGFAALVNGDTATALLRARENIAIGLQLMRGGSFLDHIGGLVVTGIGTGLMEQVGHASNSRALLDEELRLRQARIRMRREEIRNRYAWFAMTANPRDRELLRQMQRINAPGYYHMVMGASAIGYCLNPREVLFGIDPERLQGIDDIAKAWGAPRAHEMALGFKAWLEDIDTHQINVPVPIVLAPLRWLGLGALRSRIINCGVERTFGQD